MTTLIILLVTVGALLGALAGVFKAYNQPKIEKYKNERERIELEEENADHKNDMEERAQKHKLKLERRAARAARYRARLAAWKDFWRR